MARRVVWRVARRYDPSNPEHRLAKKKIEEGDGLPDMCLTPVCDEAAKEARASIPSQVKLT